MSNNGYFLKAIVVNSTRLCSSSIGLGYMIHVFQLAVVGMANRFVLLLDFLWSASLYVCLWKAYAANVSE